jgi:hypothetical protein
MHKNGAFRLSESGEMARWKDGKTARWLCSFLPPCLLASLPFSRCATLPFSFTISFLFTKVKVRNRNNFVYLYQNEQLKSRKNLVRERACFKFSQKLVDLSAHWVGDRQAGTFWDGRMDGWKDGFRALALSSFHSSIPHLSNLPK